MDSRTGPSSESYEQLPAQRSPAAVKVDNLVRRTLRVNNPYDAGDVAAGLARLYREGAQTMRLEEQGLPFVRLPAVPAAPTNGESPSGIELYQARSDFHRDIDSLINNALLKDIQPELRGWQSAIENLVEEGSQSARYGLDPRQRDRTFAIRRTLGDYARAARFVGALTPTLNLDYRRFAQSLDEISSMLLVMLGDSLARVGFGSGRFLLQAPASELQERREAALNALRHLLGLVNADRHSQEEWPRAMHAYRTLLRRLDDSGNSDLRSLFQENTLAQIMDDLIARATTPGADGLRALGSTAAVAVQQLRRMVRVSSRLVDPDSPPLKFFLVSLQLFYEAFTSTSSGFRLLFISRPTITFYGLYGLGGPDAATMRLQSLILRRSNLAQLLDCYLACGCTPEAVRLQVLFDKVLYDLDRAIDLYALGSDPEGDGEPEVRAATFGLIAQELIGQVHAAAPPILDVQASVAADPPLYSPAEVARAKARLDEVLQDLRGLRALGPANRNNRIVLEIELALGELLARFVRPPMPDVIRAVRTNPRASSMMQELCLQYDQEAQWPNLLQTMTPSCYVPSDIVRLVLGLLDATRIRYFGRLYCAPVDVTIPPTRATSAAGDTYGEYSEGGRS